MRIEGRKILSSEDIENKSAELLTYFNSNFFNSLRVTPVLDIASFLSERHNIIFRYDDNLGFSQKDERILGAFNPKKKVILIDASLKQDQHKFNFTLAHELGHLALHRKIIIDYDSDLDGPSETINERVGDSNRLRNEVDWIEWQANYYASALLMPKGMFKACVITCQQKLGISRVGKIFIDDQRTNQSDYRQIVIMLSEFFKVSQMAVDFRLWKLGLIDDHRSGRSIKDIFDDLKFY